MFMTNPALLPALLPVDLTRGGSNFVLKVRTDVKEIGLYLQDAITMGNLTLSLGLRGDIYRGLSSDTQLEPRVGLAYNVKQSHTVLRASYARVLETPFNENLIFASTTGADPVINAL